MAEQNLNGTFHRRRGHAPGAKLIESAVLLLVLTIGLVPAARYFGTTARTSFTDSTTRSSESLLGGGTEGTRHVFEEGTSAREVSPGGKSGSGRKTPDCIDCSNPRSHPQRDGEQCCPSDALTVP